MSKVHDIVANRIAKKLKTYYNPGRGPDIFKNPTVVEVVLAHEVAKKMQYIEAFEGPTYIAGATPLAIERAKKVTKGTGIGVMDQFGKILKQSTR